MSADPPTKEDAINECDTQKIYTTETDHVCGQDSFAESNFSNLGVSTRGDGSFEYSDYDDQSVNRSQSFMDETHGPALLAFVEDYILGQRLEILDTCASDDDAASCSSSSSGSETCFSHDESRVNIPNKTVISLQNAEDENVGALNIACTITDSNDATKKSRWESLLHSLSASKRKDSNSHQTESLIFSQATGIVPPRPSFLTAMKMKIASDETTILKSTVGDESAKPIVTRLSPIAPTTIQNGTCAVTSTVTTYQKALDKLHRIRKETEKNPATNKEKTEPPKCHAESKREFLNISADEPNKYLCGEKDSTNKVKSLIKNQKSNSTPSEHVGIIFQSKTDQRYDSLSVHSEGVEIPNIPQFAIEARFPDKERKEKRFLRQKGRVLRVERLAETYNGHCDGSSMMIAQTHTGEGIESKSMLASNASVPEEMPETKVLQLVSHVADLVIDQTPHFHSDQLIERQQPVDVCLARDGDTMETCIGTEPANNIPQRSAVVTLESLDPINEIEEVFDCGMNENATDGSTSTIEVDPTGNCVGAIEVDTTGNCVGEPVDSPSTKIETTIATGSPTRKATTSSVQIEFRDWAGNDVEIIKETTRSNRLLWKHGKISSTKSQSQLDTHFPLTIPKFTKENIKEDQHITVDEIFPSLASVCNYEITSYEIEKTHPKARYFKRESAQRNTNSKGVLISPVNMPPSVTKDFIDAASQGNTECCLESSAESMTSRVVDEKESYEVSDVKSITLDLTGVVRSSPVVQVADEAFLLERAMQQVHAEEKFSMGYSKTRRYITSPVTLYRFLDFNPCRNELTQKNSYDFMYDPTGLSVCQMPKIDQLPNFGMDNEESEAPPKELNQKATTKSANINPGSSLKKVLRRLKPNKVAFRDNLVDVYSKDSEHKQSFSSNDEIAIESNAPTLICNNDKHSDSSKNGAFDMKVEKTQTEGKGKSSDGSRREVKDKLKALLTEKYKSKSARIGTKNTDLLRSSSNKSLGSATKALAAIKAEYMKRRKNSYNPEFPINKTRKQDHTQAKTAKSHAAKILEEFKKAHAEGKLQRVAANGENENGGPMQMAGDSTIITYGTKQSQMSSLSKLTFEEKKLAHRLLNDIQLLAMIEKKRQAMGQTQSLLKSADIDKSVQLLKSIEASRSKNRSSKEDSTAPLQQQMIPTMSKNSDDSLTKNTSIFGGLSTLQLNDITSSKRVNN